MNPDELKVEALKLAVQRCHSHPSDDAAAAVKMARDFYWFLAQRESAQFDHRPPASERA